jgi:uncharacterized protein YaeQ
VDVLAYGGRAAGLWWESVRASLERQDRLSVCEVAPDASQALAALSSRTMRLHFTIQEGDVVVTDGEHVVPVSPRFLKSR